MKFAVVDIETTGGWAKNHRVIEVAVVLHDGVKEEGRFESLVKPGRNIPPYITGLTGISAGMLEGAPEFFEIADQLRELLEDRVFVAHNVNFDFSFLQKEFKLAGLEWKAPKLCTVRAGRKLIPGLPSYSLGRMCDALGIPFTNRHRAMADAKAASQVLEILVRNNQDSYLEKAIKRNSGEAVLPANLPKDQFDSLPEKPGVYYFKNEKGKVIYVGKARRIKSRVRSHFSGSSAGWQKQQFKKLVYSIDYELTGNELTALLLEAHQIKKLWPRFNQAQKRQGNRLGLVAFENQLGYLQLGVHRVKRNDQVLIPFHTVQEGRSLLWSLIENHGLCPKLCSLEQVTGACFELSTGGCDGACTGVVSSKEYNQRVQTAIEKAMEATPTLAIIGHGRATSENSIVLVENGRFMGFGFAPKENIVPDLEWIRNQVNPYKETVESRGIIRSYLRNARTEELLFF